MPIVEDRVARRKLSLHDRELLKISDKLMRQEPLFDNDLLRANPLPDPPPDPTKSRWGILAGASGTPDQLWLWSKGSSDLFVWAGPIFVLP